MQTLFDEFAETLLTARTGVEAFVASKDWTLWRIAGACRFTWAPQTPFFETGVRLGERMFSLCFALLG